MTGFEQKEMNRKTAVLFLVSAAVLWSMGGLLIKLITWNAMAISGTRSAIAALLFLAVIKKPRLRKSWTLLGGALAYTATVCLFVTANKMTTAANAILLQYTAPVYVALLSARFLKEKIRLLDWLMVFAVIGGMLLFFFDSLAPGNLAGNIIAILSGVSFAAMVIFLRLQKDESPLEVVFFGNVLSALIALPYMFGPLPDLQGLAALAVLGVFQLGLSYILYSLAIRHVTALEAILIPVIEPVLNPVWVFLLIGEIPGPLALAGGAVVILSVTVRCVLADQAAAKRVYAMFSKKTGS